MSNEKIDIDTGDAVYHGPSGETWLVAYVEGDYLTACGWPETRALLTDCTLVRKATPERRRALLREMADMHGDDSRKRYAIRALADSAEGRSDG